MHSVLVITGPTASGKGSLAFELAQRLGGEIVSMDSMKVYRELDIVTAKPDTERRRKVPHHLLDIVDPDDDFSTGDYLNRLESTLSDLRARSVQPLISGGTALYLKAYIEGFRDGPPADWEFRRRLLEEAELYGVTVLHERLQAADPVAAGKIHCADLRRIVRALEVCSQTGQRASEEWTWGSQTAEKPCPVRLFGIAWERPQLYERINQRVERMVEQGLFDEVERLIRRQPPLSRSAAQAIGYKEFLERDEQRLPDVVERIQQGSRRFAKRQMTWFRKFPIEWVPAGADPDPARWADEVLSRFTK